MRSPGHSEKAKDGGRSSSIERLAKEEDPPKGDLDMILGIKKSGLRMLKL